MKIAAIVAEFNPFHNGHRALATAARAAGADYIVAVMSGSYVQRGEPAIADKLIRTNCALAGGVDMVLELPLAYATATAQRFAAGAMTLLKAAGMIDTLAFGSESGDVEILSRLADAVDAPPIKAALSVYLSQGITFAKARQLAVAQVWGDEMAKNLETPNNALAIEYIRQAHQIGWNPTLFTIPRVGAAHDASLPTEQTASASFLRKRPLDWELLDRYMPQPSVAVLRQAYNQGLYPSDPKQLETAILAHLRRLSIKELSILPDLSEGLENRLYAAVRRASSLEELYGLVKTKRYTLARVRRLVLAAFLGVTKHDQIRQATYIRVLGCRNEAKKLLGILGRHSQFPVGSSLAQLEATGPDALATAQLESLAGDLYTLSLPSPRDCGYEYRAKLV